MRLDTGRFRLLGSLAAAAVLVLGAAPLFAQSSATLRGTITDTSGAVLPGATVQLISEATKASRQGVTDSKGGYFFAAVQPGVYTLKVELTGFKAREVKNVQVSANAAASLDTTLEVGTQTETVTVSAEREMIRTETGAREGLITPEQIESVSIIGRNPLELLRTLPGVVSPEQSSFEVNGIASGFGQAGQTFSVNGARAEQTGITMDGANLRDIGNNGGMMNTPNNEFVQEVKVQMSNYAAEFGTAALNVQAITKSGSSEFHGTLYDYLRDYHLAANDRARNYADQPRAKSKYNYPGFNLSGPVLLPGGFNKNRDKAFFFFGWEWNRQTIANDPLFGVVPTAGMRQGLFNDYGAGQHLNLNTSPNIPRGFPGAGTPAPGGDLQPYIDPQGLALLNLYPQPNYNDPDNRYNYVFDALTHSNRNQGVLRVDYNISDNTKAYVRLAKDSENNTNARGLWWQPTNLANPSPIEGTAVGKSAVANLTSVLSPTVTNEFIFSWSQLKNDNHFQNEDAMLQSKVGTNVVNPFGASPYIPELVLNFNSQESLWWAQDVNNIFAYNGFLRFADNFTKVLNAHAVKAGAVVERQYKEQNFQHQNNIQLVFANWEGTGTGNEFGDVLVGRPNQAVVGQPSAVGNFVAWNIEAYVQDSWKVNKNLTLEYGVRFGKWSTNDETNDLGAIFDPNLYDPNKGQFLDADRQQANGLAYVRTGQVPPSLTGPRPLLWMPRVNFAWDLGGDGKTIVRGGGGIFFNREQGNAQYNIINLPPNSYAATLNSGSFLDLGGGQGLTYDTIGLADPFSNLGSISYSTMSLYHLDWPRMYQVSGSIARRIPWNMTFEAGYVGTFGRHLAAQQQENVVPPGTFLTGTANGVDLSVPANRAGLDGSVINQSRPYPSLTAVNIFEPVGKSDYNALQLTLSRQTGNFTFLAAYTYSRFKGTIGNDFAQIDPIDPSRSYGVLLLNRPHNATLSWTWRLGDPAKNGGFAGALLNGWNLSGVSTYTSGEPIRLGFTGDLGNTAQVGMAWYGTSDYLGYSRNFTQGSIGPVTPTYTCDPSKGGDKVGGRIFDIACVGIPAFGETGPLVSPYDLRGPSRNFHDITVFKDFRIGSGSKRIQFRAGAFNVFNQAFPIATSTPGPDIDTVLEANCNVHVNVPNGLGNTVSVCDPTQGYHFTDNTINNFGKVITKRGHRVIELALRLFF